MEILLWWLVPLLVCSLTLWSWIIRGSLPGVLTPAITRVMKPSILSTVGFWGLHEKVSGLLNLLRRPKESYLGNAAVRALHWAVYPSWPPKLK
jgi:hypothetical protein